MNLQILLFAISSITTTALGVSIPTGPLLPAIVQPPSPSFDQSMANSTTVVAHLESRNDEDFMCKSWFFPRAEWRELPAWKRHRYEFGTTATDFQLTNIGEREWIAKMFYAKWLYKHRLEDQKLHKDRFECLTSLDHNLQVYFHHDWDTWLLDVDESLPPVGDNLARCMYKHMRWSWQQYTGCSLVEKRPEGYIAGEYWKDRLPIDSNIG